MSYDSQEEYDYYASIEAETEADMANQMMVEEQIEEERNSTMNADDIMEIKEIDITDVNSKLEEGWKILHFGMQADSGFPFDGDHRAWIMSIMGKPRPQYCVGETFRLAETHDKEEKRWDNEKGIWYCDTCKEAKLKADAKGEQFENVPF